MKAKKLCIALLSALLLTCVSLTAFSLRPLKQVQADTVSDAPTFTVINGTSVQSEPTEYLNIADGNVETKICVNITNNPYYTFQASDVSTIVTGYKLYTGNDTNPDHMGRNPKSWKLQGSIDGTNWTDIHTVENDDKLPTVDNNKGYNYTLENTTPNWYYKITFTARQGETGENATEENDYNLMQLSEIEFTATVGDVVEIDTEAKLASVFANGGKAKLTADIELTAALSVYKKAVELDLGGHVISGKSISVLGAAVDSGSVLILKDSDPAATHTDANLPAGGVVASEIHLTRNQSDETWVNKAILYANGGTVTSELNVDTSSAQVDYFGTTMTTFKAGVKAAKGIKLNGGLYYGEMIHTESTSPYTTSNKKVEFKIGDTVYATQFVKSGAKATMPIDPTKDGYEFVKWYNSEDNNYYDYTSAITSDLKIMAMWIKEVGAFADLKTEINSGNSVKLTADINMTDDVSISSGKNVIIDLNGHVIAGNNKQIYGKGCGGKATPGPNTKLTIIDSNPTATHEDSSLPIGGYINTTINVTASSNTGDTGFFNLHANGGTIKKVHCPSFACYIIWSACTPSSIESVTGSTGGANPTSKGGLYYFDRKIDDGSTKVTFKDGDTVYAVLGMSSETPTKKTVEPRVPVKSGYVFDSWYNGDTKYDFSTTVEADVTLTARWVEDNTAPVIAGVENSGVYCENKEVIVTDSYLDKVTVDGIDVALIDGKFTLDMSSGAARVIVATDKALNSTTVTAKFGHTFGTDAWVAEAPATCTEEGMAAHYECSACDKLFDENKTETTAEALAIAALGHDWSTNEIITEEPANCTETGKKAHWHCDTCNKDFDSDKGTEIAELTIAAIGHNFGEWIEEVAATEKTEGVKGHKDCSVCGKHFDKDGVELESLVIEKLPESGLSGGAVAGIAVGGIAVLGCGGFSIFWFIIKKKKWADLVALFAKK